LDSRSAAPQVNLNVPGLSIREIACHNGNVILGIFANGRARAGNHTFRINTTGNGAVTVRISVSAKDSGVRINLNGRLDVTAEEPLISGLVTLSNTGAEIVDVRLDSADFYASYHGNNMFGLGIRDGRQPHPGIAQNHVVRTTLSNGAVVSSKLKITPVQTVAKAWRNRGEISLAKADPGSGGEISLGLLSEAVRLGEIDMDPASVRKHNSFSLERNGLNSVVLWLDPQKAAFAPLKTSKSYTVRLRLWPEGTYQLGADGRASRDTNGNVIPLGRRAKPGVVSVRVNVR